MPTERIEHPDDPRLDDYRDPRDADLIRRRRIFLAEGRFVVRTLLQHARFRPRSVLVTEPARDALGDLLDDPARAHLPVYLVPQSVMNGVAGFNIHRGCLAAGERGDPLRPHDLFTVASRSSDDCLVVLEGLLNHDNVGGVFRSAHALGCSGVLLSPDCVDPLYRKAIRVSMGAALRLPFASAAPREWPAVLNDLRASGYRLIALTPSPDAADIAELERDLPSPRRVALLLGSEGPGLTGAAIAACDARVRIPISPEADSLNVAAAAAIAIHRLAPRPAR